VDAVDDKGVAIGPTEMGGHDVEMGPKLANE